MKTLWTTPQKNRIKIDMVAANNQSITQSIESKRSSAQEHANTLGILHPSNWLLPRTTKSSDTKKIQSVSLYSVPWFIWPSEKTLRANQKQISRVGARGNFRLELNHGETPTIPHNPSVHVPSFPAMALRLSKPDCFSVFYVGAYRRTAAKIAAR